MWEVILSKQAARDAKKISASGLKQKVQRLIEVLQEDRKDSPYEKLVGNMQGYYSRRINIQYRLVYQTFDEQKVIKISRMWSHYE